MDLERLPFINDFLIDAELDNIFENFIQEARGRLATVEDKPRVSEIKNAIEDRHYVGIYYEEPDPDQEGKVLAGFRLIEPYVYGKGYKYNSKVSNKDRQYLRAYVIRDSKVDPQTKKLKNFTRRKSVSKSERKPYWRLFRIDRIQTWQTIPRKIRAYREDYNPNDKMISRIITAAKKSDFSEGTIAAL